MKKINPSERVTIALTLLILAPLGGAAAEQNTDVCKAADGALSKGQLEEALSLYQTCRQQNAPRLETLSNLGIVYTRLGQFENAVKTYQQALALDPGSPQVNMNLGLAYLKSERYENAVPAFARALVGQPDNLQAAELLAVCHYQLKQYELAAVEAERVRKSKPDEPSVAFLLGSAYLKMKLYDKAISLINFALQKASTAEAHAILGEAFLGARAYRKALDELLKAAEMQPQIPSLHSNMAEAYAGLGNTDQAIAAFQRELQKNPRDFKSNYFLGRLMRLKGDFEASKRYLAAAEQLRPGNAAVLYEYAVFALQAKDFSKAEALVRQVLEKYPDYTGAHILLSQVYFRTRRRDDAERERSIAETLRTQEQARPSAHERTSLTSEDSLPPDLERP